MKPWVKFLICSGVGLVLAIAVALVKGLFQAAESKAIFMILCDSCFVAGVLLLAVSGLRLCANQGAYDGLGFAVKRLFSFRKKNMGEGQVSFQEYQENKRANGKSPIPYLLAGLLWLIPAVIFYLIYLKY